MTPKNKKPANLDESGPKAEKSNINNDTIFDGNVKLFFLHGGVNNE